VDAEAFIARWRVSEGAERANKDSFVKELCRVLGVPEPNGATGDPEADEYVFEADASLRDEEGRPSVGKMDLYRRGCFILEAKQGSTANGKKVGTARRDTPGWYAAMADARGQAVKYAGTLDDPPPFLLACDIGYCFDLYACFDGSGNYRAFPNAQKHRLYLRDLATHLDLFRAIWLDPGSLDPLRHAERITRELAERIAELAMELEKAGHAPEVVARFLMRCLFTMFAEDIGLLPEDLFTTALHRNWVPNPETFVDGVQSLWDAMNSGKPFWLLGRLLRFNGGLFADPVALPLTKKQLELLHTAATKDWASVEPAIFGTLLERALSPKDRSRLGAHFTPRAYVERLLTATIEQPLKARWEIVLAQVRQLVPPDAPSKPSNVRAALELARSFHRDLCALRVLDPACGTGNFLWVALDIFKRIESDVLRVCDELGDPQRSLEPELLVTPKQFMGIEVRPWAKEIAELVLWIGYLQWHHKTYGQTKKPPEPVMKNYRNIECRDAVLAYDGTRVVIGPDGKPVTRWDGKTMKLHPATWKDVPDDDARVAVEALINPRAAKWPAADYVVGNPPFIGNKRMRRALGDGYVSALREKYADVAETADFVMYWWHKAALLVAGGEVSRAGLITTNSITQTFSRKVVEKDMGGPKGVWLAFAIPDHPWVEARDGAAVRIAMTVTTRERSPGTLAHVVAERETATGENEVTLRYETGTISPSLSIGADATKIVPLRANMEMSFMGITLIGEGFRLEQGDVADLGLRPAALPDVVRPYVMGRDLAQRAVSHYVIDFFGYSESEARKGWPDLFQRALDRVKPERDENPRKAYRDRWWIFGEPRDRLRTGIAGLQRYIATARTARHRVFQFVPTTSLVDSNVIAIASDDAFVLGVLSSHVHVAWAASLGATLEDRPHYTSSTTFEPFPFPACDAETTARIRQLGEEIDAHRKRQQSLHPELTITTLYNVLDKLRRDQPLTIKEHAIHRDGLLAVLKSLHDQLDALVVRAYGWAEMPSDSQVVTRLQALNAERALAETEGTIAWLREDYQRKVLPATVTGVTRAQREMAASAMPLPWPKEFPDQVALVRDLMLGETSSFTAKDVAAKFSGATAKAVEPALETLAALGIVAVYATDAGRRWKGLTKTRASDRPPAMTGTDDVPAPVVLSVAERVQLPIPSVPETMHLVPPKPGGKK
jgi:hypothetical protein